MTRTGTSIGTPYYMSPEQCRGEKIDGRSDIYALGVQLFQLLTGKLPYKAENTTGIILKHIQDPVPRLPVELCQYQLLLDKMMAKDKEMRISGGAELVKFIDAFLTAQDQQLIPEPNMATISDTLMEMPTSEQITPLPLQPSIAFSHYKQAERKKWLLPSLLALAIIASGTMIYFLTQSHSIKTESKLITGEETVTQMPMGGDAQKTNNLLGKNEPPTAKTKNNAESLAMKDVPTAATAATVTTEKPVKSAQDSLPKVEQTPKITPKIETPASSLPIKTTTVSDLHPDIRNEYNSIMEQLQITTVYPNLKIKGQITVNLAIDEKGKIKIQNFQPMILVTPLLHEKLVKIAIGKKIKGISLPPPQNKKNEPIEVSNWRIIFKVSKSSNSSNKIILSKQNND